MFKLIKKLFFWKKSFKVLAPRIEEASLDYIDFLTEEDSRPLCYIKPLPNGQHEYARAISGNSSHSN